ncbi:cupin domain-containing protein [Bhargavaea beijingensis]|uniref:Cupin domain-containing protein n=1 Tax=Bhargavaea beijingensis TaxID=426756 RepID=A0ABX9ZCV7_9BACL|nr:cupin domain-containing protein [Bhargavaea beijingensis]RSK31943.1 cupin domain-containing protein [Bhargavaea beijingensis]
MKRFRIDAGTQVTHNGSDFTIQPFVRSEGRFQTALMTLGKNGIIRYHQADVPQLLIVLSGSGTVCNEAKRYLPVREGSAVFWEQGEWHETRTEKGMTALVIEGEGLEESDILLEPS